MYATVLGKGERVAHALASGRRAYVHLARGTAVVNGQGLAAGDALKASDVAAITLENAQEAEVLLFDLA